jgi:LuxR family maltose regulon positive regulatory protein
MADLFLIQLDKQQEWYHFHHLFRDALHQKLSGTMPASQINKMHARIADWFFAHNLSDQAIYHAMEASDLERATSYMEQTLCDILNREDRAALQHRLQLIPEELILKSCKSSAG